MKPINLLTALIVAIIIGLVVLARAPLRAIFTNSPSQEAISDAKSQFSDAQAAVNEANKAIEIAELDLNTKKESAKEAAELLEEARINLEKVEADPLAIQALAESVGAEVPFVVEVLKSNAVEVLNGVSLSGKAEAAKKLSVTAEVSGRVISQPLPSGSTVVAGDVLCSIDPGTSGANLEQAKANFNTAATQVNVDRRLQERGLTSNAAVLRSRASLEQAQAALEQAELMVSKLQIKAPFSGVLETQTAEKGTLMQPGSPCATIIGLDRVNLVAYAAESQIADIRLGAQSLAFINRSTTPVEGTVTFVGSAADPVTRAYRVEVNVGNEGETILDGSSARINIALAGTKGHLVPQNAVTLNDKGLIGVMTYKNGAAEFVAVSVVRDTPKGTWITGLEDEAEIIISGQEYAADGRKIQAEYSATKTDAAIEAN